MTYNQNTKAQRDLAEEHLHKVSSQEEQVETERYKLRKAIAILTDELVELDQAYQLLSSNYKELLIQNKQLQKELEEIKNAN